MESMNVSPSRTLFKTVKSAVRADMTWLEQPKINKFSLNKFLGFFKIKSHLKSYHTYILLNSTKRLDVPISRNLYVLL